MMEARNIGNPLLNSAGFSIFHTRGPPALKLRLGTRVLRWQKTSEDPKDPITETENGNGT